MVMVDKQVKPQACWEFEAEVLVLHHPTTISTKYQAMGQYSDNYVTRPNFDTKYLATCRKFGSILFVITKSFVVIR